jgi:hypothetical protein
VLPDAPKSTEQFGTTQIEGLAASVRAVTPLREDPGAEFEARVVIDHGAVLDWSESVPSDARPPVTIAIGGPRPPAWARVQSQGVLTSHARSRIDVRLPTTLPGLATAQTVWVGAEGQDWQAIRVTPNADRVTVEFRTAASIRVLHDGPAPSSPLGVVLFSATAGGRAYVPVETDEPIVFLGRPTRLHEVWLAEGDGPGARRLSPVRQVTARLGDTVEVDLRDAAHPAGGAILRGRLRLGAAGWPVEAGDPRATLQRCWTEPGHAPCWLTTRHLEPSQPSADGIAEFEARELAPGAYRLLLQPVGLGAEVLLEEGAEETVELDLASLGSIAVELPASVDGLDVIGVVTTAEADPQQRNHCTILTSEHLRESASCAVGPGTYIVSLYDTAQTGSAAFESGPIQVESGRETTASLQAVPRTSIGLTVIDSGSGEAVGFDLLFWHKLKIVGVHTGKNYFLMGQIREGGGSSITGITGELGAVPEPVRVIPAEHTIFEFETIGPLDVTDGQELRIRAKRRL